MSTIAEKDRALVQARLAELDLACEDLYSLLKRPQALAVAAPVLMTLFREVRSISVKLDLLRLASKGPVSPQWFVEEMTRLSPMVETGDNAAEKLAWTIGDALRIKADASIYDDLVRLVTNKRLGKARQMLPYALASIEPRRAETIVILLNLLDDDDITPQVIDALRRLEAVEAIPKIRCCLESESRLVRSEAMKAIRKLEKAATPAPSLKEPALAASAAPRHRTVEVSANFDLEHVSGFLTSLADLVEGLSLSELERVESRLLEMEADEEYEFDFVVRFAGQETSLQLLIYMSDVDAPHLHFLTSVELAEAIDRLMGSLEELE